MKSSYSDLACYKRCPLQFRWMKLGGYHKPIDLNASRKNMFIGYLLQNVVEKFYKEQWWRAPTQVLTLFRNSIGEVASYLSKREKIQWMAGEYEHWIQVAQDTVKLIIETIKREKLLGRANYAELPVTVSVGAHEILGRIDFVIDRSDEEMLLLDGKGGAQVGRYVDKEQLILYDIAAIRRFHRLPTKVGFWWYRFGKLVWHNITEELREKYLSEAAIAFENIGKLKFDPTPGSHCRLCDFRMGCDIGQKHLASKGTQLPDVDLAENQSFLSL